MKNFMFVLIAALFVSSSIADSTLTDKLHCASGPFIIHYVCIPNDDPVCVRYADGTLRTIGNSCFACSDDTNVDYYTQGVCPSQTQPGRVFCRADQRGVGCQTISSPVCATFKASGGHRASKTKTEANWCMACSDPKVEYYVSGECQ